MQKKPLYLYLLQQLGALQAYNTYLWDQTAHLMKIMTDPSACDPCSAFSHGKAGFRSVLRSVPDGRFSHLFSGISVPFSYSSQESIDDSKGIRTTADQLLP